MESWQLQTVFSGLYPDDRRRLLQLFEKYVDKIGETFVYALAVSADAQANQRQYQNACRDLKLLRQEHVRLSQHEGEPPTIPSDRDEVHNMAKLAQVLERVVAGLQAQVAVDRAGQAQNGE
jgi:hypothetical protein